MPFARCLLCLTEHTQTGAAGCQIGDEDFVQNRFRRCRLIDCLRRGALRPSGSIPPRKPELIRPQCLGPSRDDVSPSLKNGTQCPVQETGLRWVSLLKAIAIRALTKSVSSRRHALVRSASVKTTMATIAVRSASPWRRGWIELCGVSNLRVWCRAGNRRRA